MFAPVGLRAGSRCSDDKGLATRSDFAWLAAGIMTGRAEDLPLGTSFITLRGRRHGRVVELLGAGGQGAVYTVDIEGSQFALKWYHDSIVKVDKTLRARLSRAIGVGPPTDRFLWPIDLVEVARSDSFGYVMPLRQSEYAGMRSLIAPPPKRLDLPLAKRVMVCHSVAHNFLELHARGFCYQDINFGNIFLHPNSGDIVICDNDNVDVDGMDASVFGTRKFMAPEVVMRRALPSTKTDLFSMAVLFFYILHGWHPLDGRREAEIQIMDSSTEVEIYGNRPVFLFDPSDQSNGPVPGFHDPIVARWLSLSPTVRTLFVRSFTAGLRLPGERILEPEWRGAFARMVDAIVACRSCGFEQALYLEPDGQSLAPHACVACRMPIAKPPVLLFGREVVTLSPGGRIALRHLNPDRALDFTSHGAVIEAHPDRPNVWGLRNLTSTPWRATLPDAGAVTVEPGRAVRIMHGATFDFGRRTARVLAAAPAAPRQPQWQVQ
jgi:DNA-binding helix-hairpin-helix protein with protein kinase domain